jgi:arginine deiminase
VISLKDEIKEILDNLKYTAKKHTIQVLENGEKIEHCPQEIETELRLNTYSANILYDYITNLQHIEQDHQKLNGELREENKKLQEENERLRKQNTEYQDEIFARDNNWYDMQD